MSIVRKALDKSSLLQKAALRIGNKTNISGTDNVFLMTNYHFQHNTVFVEGNGNSFTADETSYARSSSFFVKGCNNTISIEGDTIFNGGAMIHVEGNDNRIVIGRNCTIRTSSVFIHGDHNEVYLGCDCRLMETKIHIEREKNLVQIGNGCTFHGRTSYPNTLFSEEGGHIIISDDAMFAHGIRVRPTDSHYIIDMEGRRLNPPEEIVIGNHCWIGLDVVILKGSWIPAHCVVAARAVCTKKYSEEHCILAGMPAKVVKRNIDWERELIID